MVAQVMNGSRALKVELGPYRLGLVGDVHAEDVLLEVTLGFLRQSGIRTILCTGDVVDGWGNTERCCRMLQEHGVATVLGNHDEWYLNGESRDLEEATPVGSMSAAAHAFVAALPRTLAYATPFGSALLCHGLGENNDASVERSDDENAVKSNVELQKLIADPLVRIVMNGHTHEAMVRHFAGLTIVNAGSLHRDYESGFVIVDLAVGTVEFLTVDGAGVGAPRHLGLLSARH
jgi:predicted phosphodiesterase